MTATKTDEAPVKPVAVYSCKRDPETGQVRVEDITEDPFGYLKNIPRTTVKPNQNISEALALETQNDLIDLYRERVERVQNQNQPQSLRGGELESADSLKVAAESLDLNNLYARRILRRQSQK